MAQVLFIMAMFYCTAPNSCWHELPDGDRVYHSRSECDAAIAARGRDYLASHFLKDDTELTLTCADKSKPLSAAKMQTAEFSD